MRANSLSLRQTGPPALPMANTMASAEDGAKAGSPKTPNWELIVELRSAQVDEHVADVRVPERVVLQDRALEARFDGPSVEHGQPP